MSLLTVQQPPSEGVSHLLLQSSVGTKYAEFVAKYPRFVKHMKEIIRRILEWNTDNIYDVFENFSLQVRKYESMPIVVSADVIEKLFNESIYLENCRRFLDFFLAIKGRRFLSTEELRKQSSHIEEQDETLSDKLSNFTDEDLTSTESLIVDPRLKGDYWTHNLTLQTLSRIFGVALHPNELFYLKLSIAYMTRVKHAESCRYIGKFFGVFKNYYVIEVTFEKEQIELRKAKMIKEWKELVKNKEEDEQRTRLNAQPKLKNIFEFIKESDYSKEIIEKFKNRLPPSPQMKTEQKPNVPPELPGEEGINKFVYYVSQNMQAYDWIELPAVTPEQLMASEKIDIALTGDLEAVIKSYPPFQGTERHYLVCLLIRILHICDVDPLNLNVKNRRDDTLASSKNTQSDNDDAYPRRNRPPVDEMMNDEMWVRARPDILPNGRVTFHEGADKEDSPTSGRQESGDTEFGSFPYIPKPGWTKWKDSFIGVLRREHTNWPGAYTFCHYNVKGLLYSGNGHYFRMPNINVKLPPQIAREFMEPKECTDPALAPTNMADSLSGDTSSSDETLSSI